MSDRDNNECNSTQAHPFIDQPFAALQWIDGLIHQLKTELLDSRREDLKLMRHQQDRHHEHHRTRLEVLEANVATQQHTLDRITKNQERMLEILEPWETTSRFVDMLDRGVGRLGRSWLFRTLLLVGLAMAAAVHGDLRALHDLIIGWFK